MEHSGYKKLDVWHKAHRFVCEIYRISKQFPRSEDYGITSQLRRAAFSVPANIVEGQASLSKKEFANFLNIANRSLVEAEYFLELSLDLGYLREDEHKKLDAIRKEVGRMLHGLLRSVRTHLDT